ncbi:hypothetical protein AYO44_00030 [Planctomycetaceae bacterium SCGC AG-212-F19]|nr:hypothetical protein AYO44_00030 [Planctomycetaceae bacterium SCGC AG-212-F19]
MAVSRVGTFIENLRELQLLEPMRLDEVVRLPQARGDDPMPLARELVQRGLLTPYQLNVLGKGAGRDLVIGPYRLLDRLGEGGMGTVYKACHMAMGRMVALKVIKREKLSNPVAVKRFLQEVQTAGKLVHPNIVMAFDAGQGNDTHFFAMEYIEGVDLAKLVRMNGPLPVMEACDYIRQAAQGLQHAHEKGLVHRDIKPNNLIVARIAPGSGSTNGSVSAAGMASRAVVKILDLGLARLHGDEGSALTRIGAVIGTPEFLAPEQAKNSHNVDIRADLYSLGCTFYYLLAGKVPYRGATIAETLVKHQTEEPAALDARPDIPPQLWLVVKKLLAKKPEDRYQTPADLILALSPFNRRVVPTSNPKLPIAPILPAGQIERKASPSTADIFSDITNSSAPPSRWAMKRRKRRMYRTMIASLFLAGGLGAALVFWPDVQQLVKKFFGSAPRQTDAAYAKASGPTVPSSVPDGTPKIDDPRIDDPKTEPKVPDPKSQPKGPDPKNVDVKIPEPKDPKPEPKPLEPRPAPRPEPPKKPATPDPAKQAEAEKVIKDNFKAEYARKKPAEMAEFAGKLLQEGLDTKDNPAARYVLFREARDLAVQGGDLDTALRAVEELEKNYAVPATALKLETLEKANRPGAPAATIRSILETSLGLADDLVEADEYDAALQALGVARAAAARTSNSLASQINLRVREVAEMQKEYAAAKPAAETLVKMPDDPDASYKWGRFLALYKAAWNKGLPLLAQSNDAKWNPLAERESKATEAALQLELGNTYWDLAETEKAAVPKKHLYAHAKDWYDKALGELTGIDKSTVERKLKTIESMLTKDQIVLGDKPTTPGTTTPPPPKATPYDKAMQAGQYAYQQGRFGQAVDAYQTALQHKPDDTRAQQMLKRSKYAMHMQSGQVALSQRDFRQAVSEFDKALEEIPDDRTALAMRNLATQQRGFGGGGKFRPKGLP